MFGRLLKSLYWVKDKISVKKRGYSKHQRSVISRSPLFDRNFYKLSASAIGISIKKIDPVVHYLRVGDRLGIKPHPLFDPIYYHDRYKDVGMSGMSALYHYIQYGSAELRDPHPLFVSKYVATQIDASAVDPLTTYIGLPAGTVDTHPDIDEKYLVKNLKAADLLKSNALTDLLSDRLYIVNPSPKFNTKHYADAHPGICNIHPFEHFVRFGRGRDTNSASVGDILGGVMSQLDATALLEPDLLPPFTDVASLKAVRSIDAAQDVASLLKVLNKISSNNRFGHIFFVPHLSFGGAERVLSNVVKALINDCGARVLVLITDGENDEAIDWLPGTSSLRVVNIYAFTKNISQFDVLQCLALFVQACQLDSIFILNSKIGWDLTERYGEALSKETAIYGFAFCYDYDVYGRRYGYAWTHVRQCISYMKAVLTDNKAMISVFKEDLRLSIDEVSKFQTIRQPIELRYDTLPQVSSPETKEQSITAGNVLWAGRFHKQKNIRCALLTARILPEVTFIFAGGWSDEVEEIEFIIPKNVIFLGKYKDFNEIMKNGIDIFLHTADWDGLPNVVLEAASRGLAIVARDVGGVSDLVDAESGWLLPQDANEQDFAAAILEALADSELRSNRVKVMESRLLELHTWEKFRAQIGMLIFK
ncbi:Glycosyltransferase involved in cell wall bisynthesis [Methylobacterium sp. UNC300MFChir4.1]|nr:Glycosyltransferase involved in cell wall bisynthesis [Methylobacterium sp. UNC300MFChir4.1]